MSSRRMKSNVSSQCWCHQQKWQGSVAGSSSGIDEPELDLVDPKESCVPGPRVPELEPELDLVDSDESCVPSPSVPYACTSEQELVQEETCSPLKGCIQHREPVTAVWDNIFIGNEEIARDRMKMKELGITHILNAAAVKKLRFPWEKDSSETVNTGARYYRGMNITYCGLPTTRNKVFIHCTEGVSYAPTLFLAYLMIHHYMTVEDAIDHLTEVSWTPAVSRSDGGPAPVPIHDASLKCQPHQPCEGLIDTANLTSDL
ncbi:unnamed protein product [Leuciscus chuanchicus]